MTYKTHSQLHGKCNYYTKLCVIIKWLSVEDYISFYNKFKYIRVLNSDTKKNINVKFKEKEN